MSSFAERMREYFPEVYKGRSDAEVYASIGKNYGMDARKVAQVVGDKEAPSTGDQALRFLETSFGQGTTLGFGDELAGAAAAIPTAIGTRLSGGSLDEATEAAKRAYGEIQTITDTRRKEFREDMPGAALAGEVAGGMALSGPLGRVAGAAGRALAPSRPAPTVAGLAAPVAGPTSQAAPGVLAKTLQGMETGTKGGILAQSLGEGAAYGAGASEGGMADRLRGAGIGALAGAAGPVLAGGGSAALSKLPNLPKLPGMGNTAAKVERAAWREMRPAMENMANPRGGQFAAQQMMTRGVGDLAQGAIGTMTGGMAGKTMAQGVSGFLKNAVGTMIVKRRMKLANAAGQSGLDWVDNRIAELTRKIGDGEAVEEVFEEMVENAPQGTKEATKEFVSEVKADIQKAKTDPQKLVEDLDPPPPAPQAVFPNPGGASRAVIDFPTPPKPAGGGGGPRGPEWAAMRAERRAPGGPDAPTAPDDLEEMLRRSLEEGGGGLPPPRSVMDDAVEAADAPPAPPPPPPAPPVAPPPPAAAPSGQMPPKAALAQMLQGADSMDDLLAKLGVDAPPPRAAPASVMDEAVPPSQAGAIAGEMAEEGAPVIPARPDDPDEVYALLGGASEAAGIKRGLADKHDDVIEMLGPQDPVGKRLLIADVREASGLSDAEFDKALRKLIKDKRVSVFPEDDRGALTKRSREGAYKQSGVPQHIMYIEGPGGGGGGGMSSILDDPAGVGLAARSTEERMMQGLMDGPGPSISGGGPMAGGPMAGGPMAGGALEGRVRLPAKEMRRLKRTLDVADNKKTPKAARQHIARGVAGDVHEDVMDPDQPFEIRALFMGSLNTDYVPPRPGPTALDEYPKLKQGLGEDFAKHANDDYRELRTMEVGTEDFTVVKDRADRLAAWAEKLGVPVKNKR